MNVFNYNTLTKQLEINEPEILLVKEFKALIQRDKSAEKDLTFIQLQTGKVRTVSIRNMNDMTKLLVILD